MKQIWVSAQLDVFKGTPQYLKHSLQANKDALSQLSKAKVSKEFSSTDLYTFYSDQLSLLYTIGAYLAIEVPSQISEANLKKDTLTSSLTKLQKECREMSTKEKEAQKEAQRYRE